MRNHIGLILRVHVNGARRGRGEGNRHAVWSRQSPLPQALRRGLFADYARRPATFRHTPEQCTGLLNEPNKGLPSPLFPSRHPCRAGSPANTSTALCREEARQKERGHRGVRSRRAPGGASGRPWEAPFVESQLRSPGGGFGVRMWEAAGIRQITQVSRRMPIAPTEDS